MLADDWLRIDTEQEYSKKNYINIYSNSILEYNGILNFSTMKKGRSKK